MVVSGAVSPHAWANIRAHQGSRQLWAVFADATSGDPYAFADRILCHFPPPGNRLDAAIEAAEQGRRPEPGFGFPMLSVSCARGSSAAFSLTGACQKHAILARLTSPHPAGPSASQEEDK